MSSHESVWSPLPYKIIAGLLNYLKTQLKNQLKNIVSMMSYYSIGPTWGTKRGFIQALTQV